MKRLSTYRHCRIEEMFCAEQLERRYLFAVQLATWSDAFVNSIGVNGTIANDASIISNIGIRNVRAGFLNSSENFAGIYAYDYLLDPGKDGNEISTSMTDVDDFLSSVKADMTQKQVYAIEGPNEYDADHGSDPNWAATVNTIDQELSSAMKADSWFSGIPYIGTSMASSASYMTLGNESSYLEAASAHDYDGGNTSPESAINQWYDTAQGYLVGNQPVYSTEVGYSTTSGYVDETEQDRYEPRVLLDSYLEGYSGTFLFNLRDFDTGDGVYADNLGLVTTSGTYKPAANSLESMISLLSNQQSTPFQAGGLNYTLSGSLNNVDSMLLEKSNGTFYLALWQEVTNTTDTDATAQNVTINFTTPVNSSVTQYVLNNGITSDGQTVSNNALTVGVTDRVQFLQITPTTLPTAPTAPANLVATANNTGTTFAKLTWTNTAATQDGTIVQREQPDGQWITVGTITGNANSFIDTGLIPSTAYSWRVIAVNDSGGATSNTTSLTTNTGSTIVDPLANFSYTTAGSSTPANWATDGAETYRVDSNVVYSTTTSANSLVYNYSNISSFQATIYLHSGVAPTDATFYVSPDDVNWTPVTVDYALATSKPSYNQDVLFVTPTSPLPEGSDYLKVTFAGASGASQLALGNMDITTPWADNVVGAGSGTDSYVGSTGTWTVSGEGADIWGTADAFNFVSTAVTGSQTLVAEVDSQSNSNAWAKAGVMFRNDDTAGAIEADVVVTPSNGVCFQSRTSTGGTTTETAVAAITAPVWVKLVNSNDSFTAFYSTNGTTWTQIGSAIALAMNSSYQAGLAVCSHSTSTSSTATFSNVLLQKTWSDLDIGTTGGSASYAPATGTWTDVGGGSDIWGTADAFNFNSTAVSGTQTLEALVNSQTNTNASAKAGVMFRNDTTAGAIEADVVVTPSKGVYFQWRSATGGTTSEAGVASLTVPVYVKLVNDNGSFSGYYSTNGTTWTQIGSSVTLSMNSTYLAGLAVCSHNNNTTSTATFLDTLLE